MEFLENLIIFSAEPSSIDSLKSAFYASGVVYTIGSLYASVESDRLKRQEANRRIHLKRIQRMKK